MVAKLKLLKYTFPGRRLAKPGINANLSSSWLADQLGLGLSLTMKISVKTYLRKKFVEKEFYVKRIFMKN